MNVGGAIIPACLSFYLFFHAENPIRMLLALAAATYVIFRVARPVPGVGIATPVFIPPIVAALAALILNPQVGPPPPHISPEPWALSSERTFCTWTN